MQLSYLRIYLLPWPRTRSSTKKRVVDVNATSPVRHPCVAQLHVAFTKYRFHTVRYSLVEGTPFARERSAGSFDSDRIFEQANCELSLAVWSSDQARPTWVCLIFTSCWRLQHRNTEKEKVLDPDSISIRRWDRIYMHTTQIQPSTYAKSGQAPKCELLANWWPYPSPWIVRTYKQLQP